MLYKTAWIATGLEICLLLVWIYSASFSKNGTDAAGRGLAGIYILALAIYIVLSILLLIVKNKYCTVAVLTMSLLPLLFVAFGLVRKYL